MTHDTASDIEKVVQLAHQELGDPTKWVQPDGYPGDIEASILDSVFSSQAVYSDDENKGPRGVVKRWKNRATTDRPLESYVEDADSLRSVLGNNAKQNGRYKSDIAAEVARNFATGDPVLSSVSALESNLADAKRRWTRVHGAGPATFHYFCLLLGLPDVKADTWVIRFVARALVTEPAKVSGHQARDLVLRAATEMGVSPIHLDHAIWRHESDRGASLE